MIGLGLFLGCGAPAAPDEALESSLDEAGQSLVGPSACPGTVWIGKLSDGSACPASAGNWQSGALFSGATGDLAKYCLVQWTGTVPPGTADFTALPAEPGKGTTGSVWLDKDCQVVAALAPSATEQARNIVAPSLIDTYLAAVEAPTAINYSAFGAPGQVNVAIVDSWPGGGNPGRSSHGFGMASIVSALACPGGAAGCPVQATPALALNLTAGGVVDNFYGGYFGFQGKIAQVVYKTANDWVLAGSPGHLVLNLSLGWDDDYNLDEENMMSAAVTSVQDALTYARCKGALVFAAAGNTSGGEVPSAGPVFPAAWETTPLICPQGATGSPLLRAVGGVDALGAPMPTSRPGATPRLVADGYLVPTASMQNGSIGFGGPYSGSSVSAATVSAAAAAIWAAHPNYTADMVDTTLYSTGVATGATADFCACSAPPCVCPSVKRVSFCNALAGAASGCRTPPVRNPTWTVGQLLQVAALNGASYNATNLVTPVTGLDCDGTLLSTPAVAPQAQANNLCPVEHLPNETMVPFSTPQPSVPICGACALYWSTPGDSILEIGINERLSTSVTPAVLTLQDGNGLALARYDLLGSQSPQQVSLSPGQVQRYMLPAINGAQYRFAVLEWLRTADLESTSDVVMIAPVAGP